MKKTILKSLTINVINDNLLNSIKGGSDEPIDKEKVQPPNNDDDDEITDGE